MRTVLIFLATSLLLTMSSLPVSGEEVPGLPSGLPEVPCGEIPPDPSDPPDPCLQLEDPPDDDDGFKKTCSQLGEDGFGSDAGCDPPQWIDDYCGNLQCLQPILNRITVTPFGDGEPIEVEPIIDPIKTPEVVTVSVDLITGEGFTAIDTGSTACDGWDLLPVVENCEISGTLVPPQDVPLVEDTEDLLCVYQTYIGIDLLQGTGDDVRTENARTVDEC